MPSIDKHYFVVEGTDTDNLRKGPGHYPDTPLPGERGTVAIAGHRTTYGAPVPQHRRARSAATGSSCRCPTGASSTASRRPRSWTTRALWVTEPVGYDRLVLSACHPLYSAAQRLVVFARLAKRLPPTVRD